MPKIKLLENKIFNIDNTNDFNEIAIEIFHYQYENNNFYKQFVDFLNIPVTKITHFSQIPFLPIEFFKKHKIVSGKSSHSTVFTSSGTTGMQTSKHYIADLQLYKDSFLKSFELFFGDVKDYTILALLPSYLEKGGSSLVYMAEQLINLSNNTNSGFYLNNYDELHKLLLKLQSKKSKVLLLGVTYALLDLAENFPIDYPELIVMETGGMKGKRKEMVREELHGILQKAFGIKSVYSEYGMTELLSQGYSYGNGIFNLPPWMRVLIRDVNDPLTIFPTGKAGGINIIDLANIHTCSFIATQDLGKLNTDNSFEIIGRFDSSDVRGCNLMVV